MFVDDFVGLSTNTEDLHNDLFRLGRPRKASDHSNSVPLPPRPVILKLASAWDRRIVLSTVRKLKDYAVKRIFIREDLSPEVRQKRREYYLSRNASGATSVGPHVHPANVHQVQLHSDCPVSDSVTSQLHP